MRGYLSLAIVWTQFLSCCIDHRQGVAEGGHIWGGGTGQEGGWSLESVTERERAGVGGILPL